MPMDDVHDHRIPQYGVVGEVDWRAIERLSQSIYRPKVVANTTARAQYVADLAALDTPIVPSTSNPVFVWRVDAGTGRELEVTVDGSTWRPVSGGAVPFATAAGVASVTTTAGVQTQAVPITFPVGRFTQPPIVVPTIGSIAGGTVKMTARVAPTVTTTGATLYVYHGDGTTLSAVSGIPIPWHAIQMTADSAAG